jgi:hypothetical protein
MLLSNFSKLNYDKGLAEKGAYTEIAAYSPIFARKNGPLIVFDYLNFNIYYK